MVDLIRPPFPQTIDNSMRSAFVECPKKFFWEYLHHFKSIKPSIHLHAGKAWASGLETARMEFYARGKSPEEAIARGLEVMVHEYGDFEAPTYGSGAAKSLDRLIEAFAYYFAAFPLETDPVQPYFTRAGDPMVEFSFALPLDENLLHPVTKEPLLYSGRADMIATYAGAVSIYDDKTTSQLGDSWAKQWNRRSQFTGYTWAAHAYGIPVSQIVIRGISIQKTQIKHAEAITTRTPHHVTEWHTQVVRDVKRMIAAWEEGYWDVAIGDACSGFGGCQFLNPCGSPDPMPWIEASFVRRVWDPVSRTETEEAING